MPRSVVRRAAALALPATCALAVAPRAARGQLGAVNPFSVGVAGNVAIPTGTFGDQADPGWGVDALLHVRLPAFPVRLRLEGGYQRFGYKRDFLQDVVGGPLPPGARVSGNATAWSGVANLVLPITPSLLVVRPYVIGGVGAYRLRSSFDVSGAGTGPSTISDTPRTKVGLNAGLGVEASLGVATVFGEARYVTIFTEERNTNLVPLRVGLRF